MAPKAITQREESDLEAMLDMLLSEQEPEEEDEK